MIAIVDYGVGNLFSLQSSFERIGAETVITSDVEILNAADKVLLPGVGAFRDAREKLARTGLDKVLIRLAHEGKKIMGICLGMQMLFDKSFEYGEYEGLGLLRGNVVGMQGTIPENLKIPHIGWNSLSLKASHPIFKYTKEGDSFISFIPFTQRIATKACLPHRNMAERLPRLLQSETCAEHSSIPKRAER